jgi:repressor LexA
MLTDRQKEMLAYIEERIARTGQSPTYREMEADLHMASPGVVHRAIERLVDRGFLRRLPMRARGLEVIKPQTHLNPEYQRGLQEGLRLRQAGEEDGETLAMVS